MFNKKNDTIMKKILTLVAAAIVCMGASAQVQFGGKVGFDLTNFWGENAVHGMKAGYQLGLLMEYKFTPSFAISPEVVFASQGAKENESGIKTTWTTNYINVPVMLKYYVTPSFSIDFGPQVGFNVYSKYKVKGVDKAIDIKDLTKTADFGLGLGGTYNLTENAFVQARYTMGMTNAFKDDGDKAKNSNIQIAFGMKF